MSSGVVAQVDEINVQTIAQAALASFTSKLGGARVDMEVSVVAPDDLRPGDLAHTYVGVPDVVPGTPRDRDPSIRKCVVRIGNFGSLASDVQRRVSVVAHEVFHCWQFTNLFAITESGLLPPFYAEGTAMWAGEQYVRELRGTGSSYGAEWMAGFWAPSTFDIRYGSYDAIGFWGQIAQARGGPARLWPELLGINRTAPNGMLPTLTAAIDGIDDQLVAQIASSGAGEPTWGADWTLDGVPAGNWNREAVEVGGTAQVRAGVQRLFSYSLDALDGDDDWYVVEYRPSGYTNAHWENGDTFTTTTAEVRQFCTDGRCEWPGGTTPVASAEPLPGDSRTLDVALTGINPPGSSIVVTYRPSDQLCDPPAVTLPPSDDRLTGTWTADPVSIEVMFESASTFAGGTPQNWLYSAGDVVMTLQPSGFGQLEYIDIVMLVEDPNIGRIDYLMSGKSDFRYAVAGGQLLLTDTNFTISVSSSVLGPDPLILTEQDTGGGNDGTTSFVISFLDSVLVLREAEGTRGAVFFPQTWYPVS